MTHKVEWTKVFILDSAADADPLDERLIGELRNYAWLKRTSLLPHNIRVFRSTI